MKNQIDRWVIFSTFDPEGCQDQPAVEQLAAYRAVGFKTLVVDTSPSLCDERRWDWEGVADRWRHRQNVGYDFGSYKFGLDFLTVTEGVVVDRLDLVITNDSCFGPFLPLPEIFHQFDQQPDEPDVVYGLTDSIQQGHHIQSYWVYFRSAACHHAARFFASMTSADGRQEAIEFGELALGAYLRSANCRLVPFCGLDRTIPRLALGKGRLSSIVEFFVRRSLRRWKYNRDADTQCLRWLLGLSDKMEYFNPVVLFGVQLYREGMCPLLKKSMFRENVYQSPEIPPGLNPRGMTNADVRRLLDAVRR